VAQGSGHRPDECPPETEELAEWQKHFDEISKKPSPKVGLMKFRPQDPGEYRYAVAIREGSDLWLTLWVSRSPKEEFFVMQPRADRDWNPHTSYHRDGRLHVKSRDKPLVRRKYQPLAGPFRGTGHLGAYMGHGKSIGAVCDPDAFNGVVEVPSGVLGPRNGQVVVDLVEPGCDPMWWPGELVRQEIFKDAAPWIVIRVFTH
jgi:hypothetical protein